MRKVGFMLIITFLRPFSSGPLSQTQGSMSSVAESPQVIEVSAKKYEFSPHEVHVKKGTRVQLKLRTDDRAHGLKLNLFFSLKEPAKKETLDCSSSIRRTTQR
jgi:plastocyanin